MKLLTQNATGEVKKYFGELALFITIHTMRNDHRLPSITVTGMSDEQINKAFCDEVDEYERQKLYRDTFSF